MPRRYLDPATIPTTPVLRFPLMADADAAALPSAIDFRAACGPIRDQGSEGACTGFAIAGQIQGLRALEGYPFVELSPAFIYYEERQREGTTSLDAGANPPDGLTVAQTIGVAPESDEPYIAGDYTIAPPQKALADASRIRIASWSPVARSIATAGEEIQSLAQLRAALAQKVPVNAVVLVHQSFETAPGGRVPMPGAPSADPLLGGHDIVLVGYVDDPSPGMNPGGGVFIFRNSWSAVWGDEGHGYLTYAYVADSLLCPGLWVASMPHAAVRTTTLPVFVKGAKQAFEAQSDGTEWLTPTQRLAEALGHPTTVRVDGIRVD